MKLHNGTPAQRRVWDDLATIYSIIVSLEFVEKAYVRDTITQAQSDPVLYNMPNNRYTQKCSNLLTQYKAILKDAEVQERFVDLETFQKDYNVQFTSATYRLKVGVPATVEHGGNHHHISSPSEPVNDPVNARHIAETVEVPMLMAMLLTKKFITFMDALKLSYKSKDQLHPHLSGLMGSLNTSMSKDFEGRAKIVQWLITLNQMRAADELTDDQIRQVALTHCCDAEHSCYSILKRHIISFSMQLENRKRVEILYSSLRILEILGFGIVNNVQLIYVRH